MARLAPLPKFRWTTSAGASLASGTITTSTTGTSTAKATYTDRGGLTANANPVVLDSNGEANIWLLTDARYRFLIKDSAGATLATIDDITSYLETGDSTGILNVVEDTTPQLGGNLDVNGKNIVSVSNADINITPNGTGTVVVNTDFDVDNININANTISSINSNVDINLSPNGTGTVVINTDLDVDNINVNGNTIISTNANGAINLTPNGTGDLVLDGLKWPQADGTNLQHIQTNGSGQLSFVTRTVPLVATQAEQEAGSITTAYASPGRQHFHPGAPKAWINFDGTGTPASTQSYKITSITDNGVGDYTINLAITFSATTYAVAGWGRDQDTTGDVLVSTAAANAKTTTTFRVEVLDSGGTNQDVTDVGLVFFGDL